jgi:aspartyl-tRNA(Asn)/glutamyl-tRNA(Gln) amidotransferase subunit C
MPITRKDIDHVAALALLALSDEEKEALGVQVDRILKHIASLADIDTDGVPPTSHTLPLVRNVLRPDIAWTPLTQREALANAPATEGGFFRVPRVVEP